MFSTEEVTHAAMRRGRDGMLINLSPLYFSDTWLDIMMFLNVAVAITCLAFCWTLSMVGFKGWLKFRILHAYQQAS